MLIILIATIVVFVYFYKEQYCMEIMDYVFFGAASIFFGFIIGCIVAFMIPIQTEIITTERKIVTLQDNQNAQGNFFLGTGRVEGKMQYLFYYQKNDYYAMEQVQADEAIIKNGEPKVVKYEETLTKSWINLFALDVFLDTRYEIYIPKNTIKSIYKLDAQ